MSNISITYSTEDAAGVAEACLRAGCPERIPGYLRHGALPEVVERELMAAPPTTAAPRAAAPARRSIDEELEAAALARFAAQRGARP